MFANELNTTQLVAIAILPTLFAIVIHEVAHGWLAWKLGDDTAYVLGRLTLNPLKHIDLIGTIIVPLFLILTVGVAFGWAKPVPVNFQNLRHPRRDTALVAAAGPFANLLMVIAWVILIKIISLLPDGFEQISMPLIYMGIFGIFINVILMVFNLIPIPPTDGGRIASSLLPPALGYQLNRLEPFGLIILIVLLLSGILWRLFDMVNQVIMQLVKLL